MNCTKLFFNDYLTANGDRLSGNGDNGNGNSGDGGNSGGGGDNGGGSTKRKCAVCLGSGKCEAPSLGYIANEQYCWGNGKCRPCSGTGQRKNIITGEYYACTYPKIRNQKPKMSN